MSILNDFAQLLFPAYCAGCDCLLTKSEKGICLRCQCSLPKLHSHDYRDGKIEKKFWGRADVQMATAFLRMTKRNKARKIIHELKYHDNKNAGIALGKLFGLDLKKSNDMNAFDFIIPVPLHPKKLFKRGYNQCDYIAEGMSATLNVDINKLCLVRAINNSSQTRQSRYKRWENVEGIFTIKNPEILEHKNILLVDDVITTGSTIEACAATLNRVHGLKLSVGAIAIAES